MKNLLTALSLLLVLSLSLAGCGKKAAGNAAADTFGTNKLEAAFASGGESQKAVVHKAESYIQAKNYGSAYDTLQQLMKDTSLSPDQLDAIKGSMLELGNQPRSAP